MKIFVCLSLLVVATANCDTLTGVDVDSGEVTRNSLEPRDYSRVDHDVYTTTPKALRRLSPPLRKIQPVAFQLPIYEDTPNKPRREDHRRPEAIRAAPPLPLSYKASHSSERRDRDEAVPVGYRSQVNSAPKVRTFSAPVERQNDDSAAYNDDYSDQEAENPDYQQDDYPAPVAPVAPVIPTYAPPPPLPVAVYNPYPTIVRRAYRIPVYRRPSYSRFYKAATPHYRPLGYGDPVVYSVPPPRKLAYAYRAAPRAVRYTYGPPDVVYDNGLVQPDGFIDAEYDELAKKK